MPRERVETPRDILDDLLTEAALRQGSSSPPAFPGDVRRSLDEIAEQLEAFAKPGPVTARRDAANEQARARFVAVVDELDRRGWSWQRIATYLGCTKTHVMGIYHGNSRVMGT